MRTTTNCFLCGEPVKIFKYECYDAINACECKWKPQYWVDSIYNDTDGMRIVMAKYKIYYSHDYFGDKYISIFDSEHNLISRSELSFEELLTILDSDNPAQKLETYLTFA